MVLSPLFAIAPIPISVGVRYTTSEHYKSFESCSTLNLVRLSLTVITLVFWLFAHDRMRHV